MGMNEQATGPYLRIQSEKHGYPTGVFLVDGEDKTSIPGVVKIAFTVDVEREPWPAIGKCELTLDLPHLIEVSDEQAVVTLIDWAKRHGAAAAELTQEGNTHEPIRVTSTQS